MNLRRTRTPTRRKSLSASDGWRSRREPQLGQLGHTRCTAASTVPMSVSRALPGLPSKEAAEDAGLPAPVGSSLPALFTIEEGGCKVRRRRVLLFIGQRDLLCAFHVDGVEDDGLKCLEGVFEGRPFD